MTLPLDQVERELARLWAEETRQSQAARTELLTLAALVSEPRLLERARGVIDAVVRAHPSRTIVAVWTDVGAPGITAEVGLHRAGGAACGDAIMLQATGGAREWLPQNVDRLALPELPRCVWWVGDLPDFDQLFDHMVVCADLVVVNSAEMDLRDLEKLSSIAQRSRDRYALADLTWIQLRWTQELVARFFDDEVACACLQQLERITIEFAPRPNEQDVASTTAGLFLGWMANALQLPVDSAQWRRTGPGGEVTLGPVVARFEHRPRADVPAGAILRVALECQGARFEIERQDDPNAFRWSREVPGMATPPQILHVPLLEESTLLVGTLERPRRDMLLESSLSFATRIVRAVAPRLSRRPPGAA